MNGILASLSAAALLAVPAVAQCLDVSTPGTRIGAGDDVTFAPHYDLGFFFPMTGSAKGGYTHCRVSTNGWLMLTNGSESPGLPSDYGSVDSLRGTTDSGPRIAPFWRDLNLDSASSVFIDTASNPGGVCTISWIDAVDYGHSARKSFQVQLFAHGEIAFSYSAGMNVEGSSPAYVAISAGNGVELAKEPEFWDLSAKSYAVQGILFETFPTGMFDLDGKTIRFVPDYQGGWTEVVTCRPATNTIYGAGCYDIESATETFYQEFEDAAVASSILQGNAMVLTPNGRGYGAVWVADGAKAFVKPSGAATILPATDDGATTITPSVALPIPGGSAPQLTISHNGIVTIGPVANHASDYTPTGVEVAEATGAAFYSWHDFNDAETGSGRIMTEEQAGVLYVTWDGVESWASDPTLVNPSWIQFQIDLVTGVVTYVWHHVDGDTTSPYGSSHVVGYSGPGASAGHGETKLPAGLPILTTENTMALSLTADVPPISTPLAGTTVIFTTRNVPEYAPGVRTYLGLHICSFAPSPPFDLGVIGAPGCFAHVMTADIVFDMVGFTPVHTAPVVFPPGMPWGFELFTQSVALFDQAHRLPNGMNDFGMVTSNAVASYVAPF